MIELNVFTYDFERIGTIEHYNHLNKRSYPEECGMMKEQLIKAMKRNQLVMMYVSKSGVVSKRG
ncbi:hypothetical protein [Lysinibacillus xylanilyticus]|uniref:Uncharacterized protein n=1 Tax=Lysinibacillus xylanilyticus TaxID=582475 RepID=A0ABT4EZU5_9BACI|nr:hypothetical protein [Lysinibacillus xylanilyticus]MCY9549811.1 hypothetical protein [Lysinibacillus xylanilyticus]MED3803993.1 hypothetical protein [Lysinibacillus xylanilyticus]